MATITRGRQDELVKKIKNVLDEYERQHPGAVAELYRHGWGSIRIRIVDDRFNEWSRGTRHDTVFDFLADRLSEDDIQEISVLLLLSRQEQPKSLINAEFDDPVPSAL